MGTHDIYNSQPEGRVFMSGGGGGNRHGGLVRKQPEQHHIDLPAKAGIHGGVTAGCTLELQNSQPAGDTPLSLPRVALDKAIVVLRKAHYGA